jgi:uncharacterized protein
MINLIGFLSSGLTLLIINTSPFWVNHQLSLFFYPENFNYIISQNTPKGQFLPISAKANITGHLINLEVTKTIPEQSMGLMYRTSLPDDRGMLFSFNPAKPVRFWMKNCQMSLDMIFLHNGVVQKIEANVPPCKTEPCPTYGPDVPVDQVIEVRGGLAPTLGVKVRDRVSIQFFPPTKSPENTK